MDFKEVIKDTKGLSEYDKVVLDALFDNLLEKQDQRFNELMELNKLQMSEKNISATGWNIVTALIENTKITEANKSGFFEILKINSFNNIVKFTDLVQIEIDENKTNFYSAGISFLMCKYSDVFNFLNKNYVAKVTDENGEYEANFRFESYKAFEKEEEIVERMARQYEVDVPFILSPISRRAVNVIVDFVGKDISNKEALNIDFRLSENGLSGVLECNKSLFWNIEITEKNEIPRPRENTDKSIVEYLKPIFNDVYHLYEFPATEMEFYYVETKKYDVKRYNNAIYLNVNENETIEDIRYFKIEIHNTTELYIEGISNKFHNFFNHSRINKNRIRTEGDIDYVMGLFENEIAVYRGLVRGNSLSAIYVYDKQDAYHYTKNKMLRSSSISYLKFEKSENIFFEDYVSYIMAFMNYYYPEFYWVGVY